MSALDQPWLHDLVTVLSAPTVVLSEPSGQIRDGGGADGVLHADLRVLSRAVLTVGGVEPAPIGSGLDGPQSAWFVSVPRALGDDIADPTVRIERERTVAPGVVSERIRVVSFADSRVDTELAVIVAADLARLSEIKAARGGQPVPMALAPDGLSWGDGELTVALAAPGAKLHLAPA